MSAPLASAKAIFLQALELTTATDLEAYLDTQCGSDAFLRREVEDLLRHHQGTEGFLESPPTAVMESVEQLRTMAPQPKLLEFLGPPSRADSLGRLGHYEVLELVGSGGMGIVLKAFDEQLHRVVAIKAMAAPLATSATARQWFVREARAAAAVNHDNVVDIYAVEGTGPVPYLVMEFVARISLEERLHQQGPLELREILRIGLQTADGLAAAHRQGVVHRDVKPANILLENGVGRVKITDFGLACAANAADAETGVIAGTPAYMSPEQARGDGIDHRSDLFSLGSVLYTLCTGQSPFRGSTPLGTLQAVCEEEPPPIRDLNSDIPAWLCEVIKKLHAKDPAERFQSAAELAETLGGYLAHVQQPSNPLPLAFSQREQALSRREEESTRRRVGADLFPNLRRWAPAVIAALVVIAVTLSLTEAGGVTQLTATVIQIFTGEGTLVIETNDPAVKVTVEVDGELVILGAGLKEIRLHPGSYKIRADKDGQPVPLERELVRITRGGREVVNVKVVPPASTPPETEKGAFVVLSRPGIAEKKFDTLGEAVVRASDGDTIEIRGNGPFVIEPIEFKHPLTIRAGAGFRPVMIDTPIHTEVWLWAAGPLRLEGLELRSDCTAYRILLHAAGPLAVANCRFLRQPRGVCISSHADCHVQNCQLSSPEGAPVSIECDGDARAVITNCLLVGHSNLEDFDATQRATVRFTRDTFVSAAAAPTALLHIMKLPRAQATQAPAQRLSVFTSDCVIDSGKSAFDLFQPVELKPHLACDEIEKWLPQRVEWREERNLYSPRDTLLRFSTQESRDEYRELATSRAQGLEDWNRFWGVMNTGSLQGVIRFHGGSLREKAKANAAQFAPGDFRLREDSAGYHAGPDGKDVGADVDLVGPGEAYERWKQTPEYQEWLKETGRIQ
jgi:serine/threonine protein kinase